MRIAVNTIIFLGLFFVILPLIIQIIVCKNTKGKWGPYNTYLIFSKHNFVVNRPNVF